MFDIIKSDDKLKTFQSQLQNEDCTKKRCIIRMANFPDVDKAVFLWFVQKRATGVPVSGLALMAKAALMYRKLHPEDGTCEKFKAGTEGFRDRRGVHSLNTQASRKRRSAFGREENFRLLQQLRCDCLAMYDNV